MNAVEAVDYLQSKATGKFRISYAELLTATESTNWILARAALCNLPREERFTADTVVALEAINESRHSRGLKPIVFYSES